MEHKKHLPTVRKAGPKDLPAVFSLCKPYYAQSFQSLYKPLDEKNAYEIFKLALTHPSAHSYVVEERQLLLGFACLCYEISFGGGYDADLKFYYVDPLVRGTVVSRMLRDALVDDFLENTSYGNFMLAEAQSEIEADNRANGKLFNNLFKKAGFREMQSPTVYLVNEM